MKKGGMGEKRGRGTAEAAQLSGLSWEILRRLHGVTSYGRPEARNSSFVIQKNSNVSKKETSRIGKVQDHYLKDLRPPQEKSRRKPKRDPRLTYMKQSLEVFRIQTKERNDSKRDDEYVRNKASDKTSVWNRRLKRDINIEPSRALHRKRKSQSV